MIFVTTAGKVGSAAARLIAQRGVPVRVLVRHPEKVAEKVAPLAQAGVEIFPGDLDSPESIDQAMRGVSRVVLVTQPVLSQELSVIDSADRAGIEHVVKIRPLFRSRIGDRAAPAGRPSVSGPGVAGETRSAGYGGAARVARPRAIRRRGR